MPMINPLVQYIIVGSPSTLVIPKSSDAKSDYYVSYEVSSGVTGLRIEIFVARLSGMLMNAIDISMLGA